MTRSAAISAVIGLAAALVPVGCGGEGPEAIDTASDACSRCRMSIEQLAHAGEMITSDRRVRKYDSLGCLALDHHDERAAGRAPRGAWVYDFDTRQWLKAEEAFFALASLPTDHMGYGIAATRARERAVQLAGGVDQKVVRWEGLHAAVVSLEAQR